MPVKLNVIHTRLHHYRFDVSKPGEASAYAELLENTLKKIGFPVWTMDLRNGYSADPNGWRFMDKIRKCADPVALETDHLFADQWNSEQGLRMFNWAECVYSSYHIKEGYWIEQTEEMRDVLRNTHKCGYCGAQDAANGYIFCPHCTGSAYLTEEDLHLTRMLPVAYKGNRAKLTKAERTLLLPIYREAQLHGQGDRSIAAAKAARVRVDAEYQAATRKAEAEHKGFTWLLDRGLQIDNAIYYSHTGRFCFGWRQGVSESVKSTLLDVMSEFPFPCDIKCADGLTLSNDES